MGKKSEKNESSKFLNITKKDSIKSNYSIGSIPNIKIKKVILPKYLNNTNRNKESKSLISYNQEIPNNLSSVTSKKIFFHIENNNQIKRRLFETSKINKSKEEKIKNMKFSETSRSIHKNAEDKINDSLNSLLIIKNKNKSNSLNSLNNLRKGKKKSYSLEDLKEEKDEQIQIGFRKTVNSKNKIKEIMLMNTKYFKNSRKIKL